jgi:hypothetical protein
MMLAAVETVTKADPVWKARRHDPDVAAQATAGESIHAASPSGFRLDHSQNAPAVAGATLERKWQRARRIAGMYAHATQLRFP